MRTGREIQDIIMTPEIPPILLWSGEAADRLAADEVATCWHANDVITFIIDLGLYPASLGDFLDPGEKEQLEEFRSDHFRKRFTVSRWLIRQILTQVFRTESVSDIVLVRRKEGGIEVKDHKEVHISLSYSGSCMALSIGKRKLGCDIEVLRPIYIQKTLSCPLFGDVNCANDSRIFLHRWTLLEAYAKLYDKNPYSLLNSRGLLQDVHFVSYCVDRYAVLSLALDSDRQKDILIRLDPETCKAFGPLKSLPQQNQKGTTHVRA
jgi:4'-phosphopantetheinyl transferase